MEDFNKIILATIANHTKCSIAGLISLLPQHHPIAVLKSVIQLRNSGWVRVKKICL